MYVKKEFEETRPEVLHQLIRSYPLCTLISHSQMTGLSANHVPFFLRESAAPMGVLQGHIARSNPLCGEIAEGIDVLAIFHGPQAYISPSWYASKPIHGRVVPTWNYAVVHVYGTAHLVENPEWLRAQLHALTTENEERFPTPWQISDAPKDFIEKMMSAIVGVEISITQSLGKWKVSQNQPGDNQVSVVAGLQSQAQAPTPMAELVAARIKDPK